MDSKISDLTLVTSTTGDDVFPLVNGGTTKKVKISQLNIPSIAGLATTTYVDTQDNLKVDKVANKQLSDENFLSTEKTKLGTIASGAEVNVNADYNAVSGDSFILNKPTIPSIAGLATTTYVDTQDNLKVDKVAGSRLITTAEGTILGNTSGVNTNDETTATIKSKLGITTLSGSNTGDQDLSAKANDNAVVHITGNETIAGIKIFSNTPTLNSLTASQLLALDGSKNIQSLDTNIYPSLTELAFVKGATSNLQTQINAFSLVSGLLAVEAQLTYLDIDYTIFDAFYSRIIADGGTIESTSQLLSTLANLRSISYTAQGYTQQLNADKFVKLGGTAEQYLMANGSALSNIATNATTTALSLATLNSTYPTAIIGFRVHCINIIIQKVIYEKTSTGWVNYSITVIT